MNNELSKELSKELIKISNIDCYTESHYKYIVVLTRTNENIVSLMERGWYDWVLPNHVGVPRKNKIYFKFEQSNVNPNFFYTKNKYGRHVLVETLESIKRELGEDFDYCISEPVGTIIKAELFSYKPEDHI